MTGSVQNLEWHAVLVEQHLRPSAGHGVEVAGPHRPERARALEAACAAELGEGRALGQDDEPIRPRPQLLEIDAMAGDRAGVLVLAASQHEHPLALRHVDADVVRAGLRERRAADRVDERCGVEVDHERPARPQGRTVGRDEAVDVLRRGEHDGEPRRRPHVVGKRTLEYRLGERAALPARPDARAFEQEHVNVARRIGHEPPKGARLPAMSAKVAAVEEPPVRRPRPAARRSRMRCGRPGTA